MTTSKVRSLEYMNSKSEISKIFNLHNKIGQGTFATVYAVSLKELSSEKFALKMIIPTVDMKRVENEVRILRRVGGKNNVVALHAAERIGDHVCLLMPYFEHIHFSDYYLSFDEQAIKRYMFSLLKAIAHVHSFDIVHRDVKPTNFLHNPITNKFCLVDFGLAHCAVSGDLDQKWEAQSQLEMKSPPQTIGKKRSPMCTDDPAAKRARMSGNFGVTNSVLSNLAMNTVNFGSSRGSGCGPAVLKEKQPVRPASATSSSLGTSATFASTASLPVSISGSSALAKVCVCGNRMTVCRVCRRLPKPLVAARRGGTLGFRPPEVMMRSLEQTTAIDVWAAGMIFISLLTGRYPFIKVEDDLDVLHALVHLLGYRRLQQAAKKLGKQLLADPVPEHDPETEDQSQKYLRASCIAIRRKEKRLRHNEQQTDAKAAKVVPRLVKLSNNHVFPSSAYNLLYRMLDPDPTTRISAKAALQSSYFVGKRSRISKPISIS